MGFEDPCISRSMFLVLEQIESVTGWLEPLDTHRCWEEQGVLDVRPLTS